jgi:hypothetical protein
MEDSVLGEDLPLPPSRLFERLAHVPNYTWDHSFQPFHSTYDNWYVEAGSHPVLAMANMMSLQASLWHITQPRPRDTFDLVEHHHWTIWSLWISPGLSSNRPSTFATAQPLEQYQWHLFRWQRDLFLARRP